jgi:hypothetical protein
MMKKPKVWQIMYDAIIGAGDHVNPSDITHFLSDFRKIHDRLPTDAEAREFAEMYVSGIAIFPYIPSEQEILEETDFESVEEFIEYWRANLPDE